VAEQGKYRVWVGNSSSMSLQGSGEFLEGEVEVEREVVWRGL